MTCTLVVKVVIVVCGYWVTLGCVLMVFVMRADVIGTFSVIREVHMRSRHRQTSG